MSSWKKNRKKLFKALEKDETALQKRLSNFYKAEGERLGQQIAAYYAKYGKNNVIEYRALLERLSPADAQLLYQDWEAFCGKYPQYANLEAIRMSIYKLNRLQGLQSSIQLQQAQIATEEMEQIGKHLENTAERTMTAAEQAINLPFNAENSQIIRDFVGTPWSAGTDFSQRIWDNRQALAKKLNNEIAAGFARGDSYERLIRVLRKDFENVSKRDAYRLIYTEGTYVLNEANARAFENDFEEYTISTFGDEKVCDICRGLEGKVFKYADRIPGENFPPLHPWCRCSFEVVVKDWDKWIDDYVAKHGGDAATPAEMREEFE